MNVYAVKSWNSVPGQFELEIDSKKIDNTSNINLNFTGRFSSLHLVCKNTSNTDISSFILKSRGSKMVALTGFIVTLISENKLKSSNPFASFINLTFDPTNEKTVTVSIPKNQYVYLQIGFIQEKGSFSIMPSFKKTIIPSSKETIMSSSNDTSIFNQEQEQDQEQSKGSGDKKRHIRTMYWVIGGLTLIAIIALLVKK